MKVHFDFQFSYTKCLFFFFSLSQIFSLPVLELRGGGGEPEVEVDDHVVPPGLAHAQDVGEDTLPETQHPLTGHSSPHLQSSLFLEQDIQRRGFTYLQIRIRGL